MKGHLMPVVASADMKKMLFTIFCCAVLMLFAAPAWAQEVDPCNSPTIGTSALPVGSATGCGVLITITGTSGNLVATVIGGGTANGNPYDGDEDQLVGIQNNSSVYIGAIRLSSPPVTDSSLFPYTSNLFGFDGDGPCNYAQFYNSGYDEAESTADCFNDPNPTADPGDDPYDYQGPNNSYNGISHDYTTGTIWFNTPIPPCPPGAELCPGVGESTTSLPSTWFGMENTPVTVVSIGETQQLVTGVTNVFPFGPFTCTSDVCTYGLGTWTETYTVDNAEFTPVSPLTGADYWTVIPVPVCAGPWGESPFGPFTGTPAFGFTSGDYGLEAPSSCLTYGPGAFVTNFGPTSPTTFGPLNYPNANSLAIIAYSDYSSLNNPVGVEVGRGCRGPDCGSQSLHWTMELNYNIDPFSIAGPIGGPVICFAPGVPAPLDPYDLAQFSLVGATDCGVDALTSYTGLAPGEDAPPPKGGGNDGASVFASLFSPALSETNPIPQGKTVGFPGFEAFPLLGMTSNTFSPSCPNESAQYLLFPTGKQVTETYPFGVNCLQAVTVNKVQIPVPWVLYWDYTTTSNVAITNLQLCQSVTSSGTCGTKGISPPWVYLSLIPVNADCGTFTGQNPLLGPLPNLALNFVNYGAGLYSFTWEPVSNPTGCEVAPVLQFNNGTFAVPAAFVYSF